MQDKLIISYLLQTSCFTDGETKDQREMWQNEMHMGPGRQPHVRLYAVFRCVTMGMPRQLSEPQTVCVYNDFGDSKLSL